MRRPLYTLASRSLSLLLAAVLDAFVGTLRAQAPTSAAIAGRVVDERGIGLDGVDVVVLNRSTGISMRGVTRAQGRFRISGLEVGGPYTVTARRIGSPSQSNTGLYLSLGQQLEVDVVLRSQPVVLQAVETRATANGRFSRAHLGTGALLSDSVIHRMPVINRDLYDLVRLVPQMSTWFPVSASGAGTRVNSVRIDGVSDQVPSSNLAAGALYGGKVMPLDAVQEYQVLLSPFDVRHGGFAGAMVNVVTRSGTNELQGNAFAYGTNERLGRNVPFVRDRRYDKAQAGLSIGGPIVRDRLLFFGSAELQRRAIPAIGPYVGQPDASQSMLPVRDEEVRRFQQILSAHGLDGRTAGAVTNPNPSSSVFLRLDAPIPRWNSRVTLRGTYGSADSSIFDRPTVLGPTNCPTTSCFPLASLQHSRWVTKRSTGAQLVSNFASGAYNELIAGYVRIVSGFRPTVHAPLVLVNVPGAGGTPAVLQSGTHEIATGQRNASWSAEATDNFSISAGPHRITAGVSLQAFDLRAFQLRGSYGIWEFASLDSLQASTPARYRVTRDTGSVTAASGAHYAIYLGDEWEPTSRLSLAFGVRADGSTLSARLPYVAAVDSTFGLRSDAVPSGAIALSPRLGFQYQLSNEGAARRQLRGGAGLFSGRPPLFWLFGGFAAYGLAARTLQCGPLASDAGPAPAFHADYRDPPLACAGGRTFGGAVNGEIDVIDARLRLPQTMRASLAVDAQLPFGLVGTLEGLYTRGTRSLFFVPLNLREPVAADRHGRLLYGTFTATGAASPARVSSSMSDVISITNQSRDRALDVTGELRKTGRIADLAASLSYGRTRDVQSPRTVSALLADNWRFARPVTGREDDLSLGISDFDQPFKVRAFGTLRSPWRGLPTDVSFYYVGGTGFPFTYVTGGTQGRGDLNADGAVGNDPIYIPRSAFDTAEIRFGGTPEQVASQQEALERFIDGASCLRAQRGAIMARNSCRVPWMNLTQLAIRQALPGVGDQSLAVELQVFNLLNLLNSRWGHLELPPGATLATTSQFPLLSQVGATTGSASQPVYRFDTAMPRFSHDNFDTYYQLQLAVRYNF